MHDILSKTSVKNVTRVPHTNYFNLLSTEFQGQSFLPLYKLINNKCIYQKSFKNIET